MGVEGENEVLFPLESSFEGGQWFACGRSFLIFICSFYLLFLCRSEEMEPVASGRLWTCERGDRCWMRGEKISTRIGLKMCASSIES